MRQEASTYHRCFPPVFHMYDTEEKHGLCGNFLGKESQMKAPFPRSTRQRICGRKYVQGRLQVRASEMGKAGTKIVNSYPG